MLAGSGFSPLGGARATLGIMAVATGLALVLSGCIWNANLGAAPPATRDVSVSISGMRFVPDHFEVHVGETIRFLVANPTDIPHELYIGSMDEQLAHHMEVTNLTGSQQVRAMQQTGYGIYLMAHDSGQFIYHFSTAGQIKIGCHVPGHWEAGMMATVDVQR